MLKGILDRLKEPSTYAGVGVLLGLVGVNFAPEELNAIIGVLTAIAAALAIFFREKGPVA